MKFMLGNNYCFRPGDAGQNDPARFRYGNGIKEKHKNRVFEKFLQKRTPLIPDGSGLGLTVVKEIVNLHQGEVWLESRVGQGTTVHLLFKRTKR